MARARDRFDADSATVIAELSTSVFEGTLSLDPKTNILQLVGSKKRIETKSIELKVEDLSDEAYERLTEELGSLDEAIITLRKTMGVSDKSSNIERYHQIPKNCVVVMNGNEVWQKKLRNGRTVGTTMLVDYDNF